MLRALHKLEANKLDQVSLDYHQSHYPAFLPAPTASATNGVLTMNPAVFKAIPAVRDIDNDIETHLKTIRALMKAKNAHSRINQFPPEILARIFQLRSRTTSRSLDGSVQSLLNITHVCTHWRMIALSTPELWSEISFHSRWWCEEMLHRSKGALLEVNFHSISQLVSMLPLILQEMERISTLKLDLSVQELERLREQLVHPAPFMHTVALTSQVDHRPFATPSRLFYPLPQPLFGDEVPRLQHLAIERCGGLNWSAPLFRSLVSLKLSNLELECHPTASQLISVLQQTSQTLQELSLRKVFTGMTAAHLSTTTVDLPKLTDVLLEGPVAIVHGVHSALALVPSAKLKYRCGMVDASKTPAALSLVDAIQTRCLVQNGCCTAPYFAMRAASLGKLVLRWWITPDIQDQHDPIPDFDNAGETSHHVWLEFAADRDDSWLCLPADFLKRIAFQGIQFVSMRVHAHIPRNVLADAFSPATDIVTLVLDGQIAIQVIYALDTKIPAPSPQSSTPQRSRGGEKGKGKRGGRSRGHGRGPPQPLIMPKLSEISLHNVRMGGTNGKLSVMGLFEQRLRQRANARCGVQYLQIVQCLPVTAAEINSLKVVVPDLVWDAQGAGHMPGYSNLQLDERYMYDDESVEDEDFSDDLNDWYYNDLVMYDFE